MVAVRNYHGTPAPPGKTPLCFQTGDFIELLKGDPDTTWWEVFHIKLKYISTLIPSQLSTPESTFPKSEIHKVAVFESQWSVQCTELRC